VPTGQRTSASNPAHCRLQEQRQSLRRDRRLQVGAQPRALQHPLGHPRFELDRARTPALLGPLHRQARVPEQVRGTGQAGRPRPALDDHQADAGGDRTPPARVPVESVEGGDHGVTGPPGRAQVRRRRQDRELVGSEPGHQILRSGGTLQAFGGQAQQPVTLQMSERIVDAHEAVQVDDQHPGPGTLDQAGVHGGQEGPAVQQPGESVGADRGVELALEREPRYLLAVPAQDRDDRGRDHDPCPDPDRYPGGDLRIHDLTCACPLVAPSEVHRTAPGLS
jgi:hypothetical protein